VCYCELTKSAFLERILVANESGSLARFLEGSERVTVFAATVGLGVDRLINRYVSVSPVKALLFQAIGAERIEALCENFCKELGLKKRFSPGYGDFALAAQREIFSLLGCEKRIGLSLTDSLLMTPTKSVTAIAY
jgi:cobalamin-dependent methionine synthase I